MLNAENPKKNKVSGGFGLAIWDVNPDTWEHYFNTIAPTTPIIKKVNISKVNLWVGEEGVINISCLIIYENNGAIRYKVLINEEEVIPLSQPYSTPAEIEIPIPKTVFTEEENLFTLVVVDESDGEVSFSYIITVEDRDTFTFKRVFDFKEDYITDENVEVIFGEGLALKEIGTGEVNIEIPTEGKSKISNIVIEGGEDKEEELIVEREMTYLNDLWEGKVYESRLLTEENFKENFVDLSQLTISNENGIKPYKLLDKPSIVTYTEDKEIPILSQTVLASTKVRFLVSKNKTNYYVYRDNEWIIIDKSDIIEKGMTKTELESIPQEAWAAWMEREAHKHSFNILIGMYSENPGKPLVRSVTVNYAENEAPVIINSVIEPDTIHNEFAYLMTDVKDYEGDRISFKVLIKKAGTEEFVQVDPPEGWHTGSGSEIGILRAYNHPYFNVGENEVKVVVKDERGVESEWTGRIIFTNTDPTIAITYDDFGMIAVIGDDDGDDIAYRLSINGELVFDYTKFFPSKKRFEYLFDFSKLRFGEENTICLEVIDTFGGYAKEEFTIVGTYRGLMFKNENGEYFVDDRGNVLMDVLFGKTLIGGQTSETKKVILENRTGFPLTDVKIFPEKADFVHGAVVEISPIEMPFTPVDTIKISEILPNLGTKDFYIRVRTSRDAYQGGYFYINSTATPVTQ